MSQNLLLDALNRELADVGPDRIDNDELLRGVLSGCGDCIKVLDLEGRLQFMSEGGKRVMEVENFETLKGCPWPEFWAGEGNAQAVDAVATARTGRTARFRNAANTAKGNPRYWDVQVAPIFGRDGKPAYLLSISRDITEEWKAAEAQKEHVARQQFLTEELTHRVKNSLMTVIAIANQTFRGEAYKDLRETFLGRIHTLNHAYDLLSEANWSNSSVRRVVESALMPFRTLADRVAVSGPTHDIPSNQALALALAINELATNATKYGALSVPSGKIDVAWTVTSVDAGATFQFEWRESGGPEVVAPTRSGFGSRLIKSILPLEFKGAIDVLYEPSGLVCVLRAPAS